MESLLFIAKIAGIVFIVIGLLLVVSSLGTGRSVSGAIMICFVGGILVFVPAVFSVTNSMATNVANKISDAPIEQKVDNKEPLTKNTEPEVKQEVEPNGKIND